MTGFVGLNLGAEVAIKATYIAVVSESADLADRGEVQGTNNKRNKAKQAAKKKAAKLRAGGIAEASDDATTTLAIVSTTHAEAGSMEDSCNAGLVEDDKVENKPAAQINRRELKRGLKAAHETETEVPHVYWHGIADRGRYGQEHVKLCIGFLLI